MKKVYYSFIIVSIFLTACKKNIFNIDEPQYFISGDAGLPDSSSTAPRMVYTDPGLAANGILSGGPVTAAWKDAETIEFCFVQPAGSTPTSTGTVVKKSASCTVTNVAGTRANYSVAIPAGINVNQPFDVYAVNSGTTATASNLTYVNNNSSSINLSQSQGFTAIPSTLATTQIANSIVQVASAKNVKLDASGNAFVRLNFKHLGALMAVSINNVSGVDIGLAQLWISGTNWFYGTGASYDLLYDAPGDPSKISGSVATNLGLFSNINTPTTLLKNTVYTFYRWFVPSANAANNLALNYQRTSTSTPFSLSIGNKPALQTGMRYWMNRKLNYSIITGYSLSN